MFEARWPAWCLLPLQTEPDWKMEAFGCGGLVSMRPVVRPSSCSTVAAGVLGIGQCIHGWDIWWHPVPRPASVIPADVAGIFPFFPRSGQANGLWFRLLGQHRAISEVRRTVRALTSGCIWGPRSDCRSMDDIRKAVRRTFFFSSFFLFSFLEVNGRPPTEAAACSAVSPFTSPRAGLPHHAWQGC